MERKPLISVVVPVYRVEEYLPQCIESVLAQTYQNLEIILVDDGSPDGSGAICDAYAARDSRIRVLHKENGGVSSARNAGLAAVTGELIAFVDGDDFVAPDIYERMYGCMEADERLDVVYTACTRYPFQGQLLHMDFFPTGTVLTGREMAEKILIDQVTSHMWLGLYKRFCWEGIVFPEGRTYEDVAMTYRAFRNVNCVYFLKEPLYYYRVNDTSITQTVKPQKVYDIFAAYRDRYDGSREAFPALADGICAQAAHYGISLLFHLYADDSRELAFAAEEVAQFLKERKKAIRRGWHRIPRTRRIALRVYYLSPALLRWGARGLHHTGLQKKMGFQVK